MRLRARSSESRRRVDVAIGDAPRFEAAVPHLQVLPLVRRLGHGLAAELAVDRAPTVA